MAKRAKSSERVSFRWSIDGVGSVRQLAERTGWSESQSAWFLCDVGRSFLLGNHKHLAGCRARLLAVEAVHKVELEAAAMVAAARKKARTEGADPALLPR